MQGAARFPSAGSSSSSPCLYELPTSCRSWFFFSSMSRLVLVSTYSTDQVCGECGPDKQAQQGSAGQLAAGKPGRQQTSRISRIVCVSNRRSASLPASLTLRRGDSGAGPIDPDRYAEMAIVASSALSDRLTVKTGNKLVGALFSTKRCSGAAYACAVSPWHAL